MNEQEMLRELVDDRIAMLLSRQPEEIRERGRKTSDLIDDFTVSLENDRKKQLEEIMDRIILENSEENRSLYLSGVNDGIRIVRWLLKV